MMSLVSILIVVELLSCHLEDNLLHLVSNTLKAKADRVSSQIRAVKKMRRRRWGGGSILLLIPESKPRNYIKFRRYGNLNNGSNWEGLYRAELLNSSDYKILTQYNNEVRNFAEHCKIASNFYQRLGLLNYIAQTSLVKTLAHTFTRSV